MKLWFSPAIAIGLLLLQSLAGCSLSRLDAAHDRSESTAETASTLAAGLRAQQGVPERETVVYSDKPWVSTQPLPPRQGLPPQKDCRFIWRPVGGVTLQQAAQEVMRQCPLNVQITPDALDPQGAPTSSDSAASAPPAIPATSPEMTSLLFPSGLVDGAAAQGNPFASFMEQGGAGARLIRDISWNGRLSGFLDLVTARSGLSWRYEPVEDAVVIHFLETRSFRIYAFDDTTQMDSTVRSGMTASTGTSGDGVSGGSSGSGISGDSGSNQTTQVSLKTSILDDIEGSVKSMLTPGIGRMVLSRATGALTVTDRPAVLRRIQQVIEQENESITTQVILNVKVLSVALRDQDQLGIDWGLVYASLSRHWGIHLKNAVPGIDPGAISGSVSILDTASNAWAGSTAMIQALSRQGRVATVRSPSVTTLNLQSAPIQIGKLKSYLASTQVSNVAQVGTTTSITPGTVTSGYNMTLLPFVMPGNELLLKININMSSDPTFETVSSGDSTAQFPSYGVQIFDQKVRLRNGETLVLSGFEQDSEDSSRSGVGSPGFFGLGGGRLRSSERQVIVVLITPVVMTSTAGLSGRRQEAG